MKRIHQTLKGMLAIATVAIFVACKKDAGLSKPVASSVVSAHEVVAMTNTGRTVPDTAIRKTSYTSTTIGGATSQK